MKVMFCCSLQEQQERCVHSWDVWAALGRGNELPVAGGVHRGRVSTQQRGLSRDKPAERLRHELRRPRDMGWVLIVSITRCLTFGNDLRSWSLCFFIWKIRQISFHFPESSWGLNDIMCAKH